MMDIKEINEAWAIWRKSAEGQTCRSGSANGEYLDNRLWFAFMAGIESVIRRVKEKGPNQND